MPISRIWIGDIDWDVHSQVPVRRMRQAEAMLLLGRNGNSEEVPEVPEVPEVRDR